MEAGKALPERRAGGWSRTLSPINPLRAVWWLFTNVRFAIVLLAVLSLVSLLGVLIPQKPVNVRGDIIAEDEWLILQHDRFGVLTDPMDSVGLFNVFHNGWFALLLGVTVASTGAYVVSRFPGTWAAITRPRKRVPDRYFEMAPNRVHVESRLDPAALEAALRAKRYRVERFEEAGATYLFGDRFQWAALGTLLTHAAVIVFILSAVVSRVDAFSSPLFISEGSMLPVFPVKDPNQMQVQLTDAHAEFAADGQPLDYRTDLTVYRRGEEVMRCTSTVNTPCEYGGYRFYQAAYFGFGAAVTVKDLGTGNTVYRETLALIEQSPSPRVRVTDEDGGVLLDETVVLTETIDTPEGAFDVALVTLDGGRPLTFWLPASGDGPLRVFEPSAGGDTVQAELREGETDPSGGLHVEYVSRDGVPSALVPDFPLPASLDSGATGEALLKMTNVVYGTDETSSGEDIAAPSGYGEPELTLVGLEPQPITLGPGESARVDNLEYTFEGQREFAGIDVRRDRSDSLVWAGAAFTVLGLMVTFWVPRRRFWAKITASQSWFAGQAASHANYTRELRALAREAGGQVPEGTDEDE